MEDEVIKALNELIKKFENKTKSDAVELNTIKATMLLNWGGKRKENPKLLNGTEKTATEMFIKIVEYYYKSSEGKPLKTKPTDCAIFDVIGRFVRWAFSLLQKYNRGAKANNFPIAEYGILGEKKRGGNAL